MSTEYFRITTNKYVNIYILTTIIVIVNNYRYRFLLCDLISSECRYRGTVFHPSDVIEVKDHFRQSVTRFDFLNIL